jgi:hypothetical protein
VIHDFIFFGFTFIGTEDDPSVRRMKAVLTHPIGDYAVQPREVSNNHFHSSSLLPPFYSLNNLLIANVGSLGTRPHGQLME